jgi:thiol-disulfide isomerase/thioredoxin
VCCADCWAEADRTKVEFGTAEDLSKAKACTDNGDPTLLAVRVGDKFTMYELVEGKFKHGEKNWYSYVGKRVSATGTINKNKFVVDTLTVTAPSVAEREAKAAIGTDAVLALKDLFGADASLAQYKGRIVVLNFWATWCVPCKTEMPWLSAIQNDYAALGVQVVGTAADAPADSAKVLKFIKDVKINFPVWLGATTGDMTRFGVGTVLPATAIVDREGKIVWQEIGIIKPDALRKQLDQMIAGNVAKVKATKPPKKKDENASLVPA